MQVFWSKDQLKHEGARFLKQGNLLPGPERPDRAGLILTALCEEAPQCHITPPEDHGLTALKRVHPAPYLDFLQSIHGEWAAAFGPEAAVLPNVLAGGQCAHVPHNPVGALGVYVNDLAAEIRSGTWEASYASAQCAVNAAKAVALGAPAAYALCRPPGHHAGAAHAMGFCYLNNAAIAAMELRQQHAKVAIVDIDVHHGNGTQAIFYDRSDVLTASMHSDPSQYYPFHTGYEDEHGTGEGAGFNTNICFNVQADDVDFLAAFTRLADAVDAFEPDALVIALDVDALRSDPHGGHHITPSAYVALATRMRTWARPTVIVQEGGYESNELGPTVAQFLKGFTDG